VQSDLRVSDRQTNKRECICGPCGLDTTTGQYDGYFQRVTMKWICLVSCCCGEHLVSDAMRSSA